MQPTQTNTPQAIPTETIQQIILVRKNNVIKATLLLSVLLIGVALFVKNISVMPLVKMGIFFSFICIFLYQVNVQNYPTVKKSYRFWNKFIYIYMAKVLIVVSILRIVSNLKSSSSPLYGFKDPSAVSRSELLVDSAVLAGSMGAAIQGLEPAAIVEVYFSQQNPQT